jgi:hypothetical protein
MRLQELRLHRRAYGKGYHLGRRGDGYSLLAIHNHEEIECADIDALERSVKQELDARKAAWLAAACARV